MSSLLSNFHSPRFYFQNCTPQSQTTMTQVTSLEANAQMLCSSLCSQVLYNFFHTGVCKNWCRIGANSLKKNNLHCFIECVHSESLDLINVM